MLYPTDVNLSPKQKCNGNLRLDFLLVPVHKSKRRVGGQMNYFWFNSKDPLNQQELRMKCQYFPYCIATRHIQGIWNWLIWYVKKVLFCCTSLDPLDVSFVRYLSKYNEDEVWTDLKFIHKSSTITSTAVDGFKKMDFGLYTRMCLNKAFSSYLH